MAALAPKPPPAALSTGPIPARAGVGLKSDHFNAIAAAPDAAPAWFEIHPENYMSAGGPAHAWLARMAELRPLSMHGVGMSLGSAEGLDTDHLDRLARLVDRYRPALVSEHLSWSRVSGQYIPDLLPLPLTEEALEIMVRNVDRAQTWLKRTLLIENPSTYLEPGPADYDEPAFLSELCRRTGCGWLLDINNIVVSCTNRGDDAVAYVDAVDGALVGEIHLAGHAVEQHPSGPLLIDDHGSAVGDAAWRLFDRLVARIGARPTLIEWDTAIPDWAVLCAEAVRADITLDERLRNAA